MADMPPTSKSSETGDISDVQQTVLEDIRRIEKQIKDGDLTVEDIPELLHPASLKCLSQSTLERLSHSLDIEEEVPFRDSLARDYRGITQWLKFDGYQEYIKHLSKSGGLKTKELIEKWIGSVESPPPTVGELRNCLKEEGMQGISRHDVLTDFASVISQEAISWLITKYEAETKIVCKKTEDTSWQLTRHDVVSGRRTYYTCCIVYADEDEGMAQLLIQLYRRVYPPARFFLPQFDLKRGRYVYETTAAVIEERCEGRVLFILSEYFFASSVCQFAVQFSRSLDAGADQGNLIPIHLTNKNEHVPRVLHGIAGIRWFRRSTRKNGLEMLTEAILSRHVTDESQMESIKSRIAETVQAEPEVFLIDPPYDDDIPPPGMPMSVYDPPIDAIDTSDDSASSVTALEMNKDLISPPVSSLEPAPWYRRARHFVRKKLSRKKRHRSNPV